MTETEAIEVLRGIQRGSKDCLEIDARLKIKDDIKHWNKEIIAIDTILDLYNREKEKNAELKTLIERNLKYSHYLEKDLFENGSNYVISKDKIKTIQKEYKKLLSSCNRAKDIDRIKALNERILFCDELLEE